MYPEKVLEKEKAKEKNLLNVHDKFFNEMVKMVFGEK